MNKAPWSSGQDASLSRWNQGFDSPRSHWNMLPEIPTDMVFPGFFFIMISQKGAQKDEPLRYSINVNTAPDADSTGAKLRLSFHGR